MRRVPACRSGSKQGGFVHAPSINHASAAALLRNAYLSHADPAEGGDASQSTCPPSGCVARSSCSRACATGSRSRRCSATSSSADCTIARRRARRAATFRCWSSTSSSCRTAQAFPFEAREIVQAGTGASAETVPAYSVVNGLRLTTRRSRPPTASGCRRPCRRRSGPDAEQGAAILAEQDALLDTLDAVKDLLMAENAYQLVQGNFDRVAAVSLAQKDGAQSRPSLRGDRDTARQRVHLHQPRDAALRRSRSRRPSRAIPGRPSR